VPTLPIDLTTDVTGVLPVANGGTGLSALGSALQWIRVNALGTALEYWTGVINLASAMVTGVLPFANGGTGLSAVGSALQIARTNAAANAWEWWTLIVDLTTQVGSSVLPRANGGTGLSAAGSAGNVLTSNGTDWVSGTPTSGAIPSGNAFPGSPSDNDLFRRTDRDILYYYDSGGSRWLSMNQFVLQVTNVEIAFPLTGNNTAGRASNPWAGEYDIYIEDAFFNYVLSGTGNWTLSIQKVNTTPTGTQIITSGAFSTAGTFQIKVNGANVVVPTSDNIIYYVLVATENSGTASITWATSAFTYRLIG
jgi:hypothetical protein